jgi:hypothetical protein
MVHDNPFEGVVLEQGTATASNNTISGSLNGLVVVTFTVSPQTGSPPTANSVATVTGNTISNNSQKGVWVVSQDDTGPFFPVASVFQNTIDNNGIGVVVGDGPAGTTQILNDHTVISQNSIFDNTPGLGIDLQGDGVTLDQPGGTRPGPNNFLNFPVLTSAVIVGGNLQLEGFARPGSVIELFIAAPDPTGFGEGKTYLVTRTEGSADDLDNTTGSYGPGPINGLVQGSDTTNRFQFLIPLAALPGVGAGTLLTATATLDDPFTSEFSGDITVTTVTQAQLPDVMPTIVGKLFLLGSNFSPDPLTLLPDTLFVNGLYHDILGRVADQAGLNSWVMALQTGVSRQAVASDFWESAEQRGLEVDQFYQTFLGRPADFAGRAGWVNALLAGASETQVEMAFLTSPEYQAAHPGAAAYISGLYADVLGRAPAAEMAFWVQRLQAGASPQVLALGFLTSPEAAGDAVQALYQQALRRPADPVGLAALTPLLQAGAPWEVGADALFASPEYFNLPH